MTLENLRVTMDDDLQDILESEFRYDVQLVSPAGVQDDVVGRVLSDSQSVDVHGHPIITDKPKVVLRITSLLRVPVNGEKWIVRLIHPITEVVTTCILEKAMKHGRSIGFIKLYLTRLKQS